MKSVIDASELLTISIMQECPIIIVEGIGDIPVYEKIFSTMLDDFEIYTSEQINGIEPGCRGVEKIIRIVNEGYDINFIKKYIAGIIDKDVKDYRGELSNIDNLVVTDYYSMETHFIANTVVKKIFSNFIRIPESKIPDVLLHEFWDFFYFESEYLYLASLDALRKSINSEADAIFSYASNYNETKNRIVQAKLQQEKIRNLIFAFKLGLEFDVEYLKKICKGKWFLEFFCEKISYFITNEIMICQNTEYKCDMCLRGNSGGCLYNFRVRPTPNAIEATIYSYLEFGNFEFIRNKIIKNFS